MIFFNAIITKDLNSHSTISFLLVKNCIGKNPKIAGD